MLARKRPHLIPVYHEVVRCVLGARAQFWVNLHAALTGDDQLLIRLADLPRQAGLEARARLIRVLDVVRRTYHQEDHQAGRCAQALVNVVGRSAPPVRAAGPPAPRAPFAPVSTDPQ
ncbi:MAG: DUF6308 family protein [Motilibacteraceae bacterium]